MMYPRRWTLPLLFLLIGGLAVSCGGEPDLDAELTGILIDEQMGPEQKVSELEAFLEKDPPPELATEALFTVGWIHAETLHQYDEARRWFGRLAKQYPQSDWVDEARWMNENMEKDPSELLPEMRREITPPGEGLSDTTGGLPPL